MKTAVIVLPTYNEKATISSLIESIFTISETIRNWEIHVLVVESSSPDGTSSIVEGLRAQFPRLHMLTTPKEGLGKAYISGFDYAIKNLNPYLIFEMDADLSHDPADIPRFIAKVEEGADLVIGTRYSQGGSIPSDWGWHRKLLSILGNWTLRLGFMRIKQTEWTNGYRAIKVWLVKEIVPTMSDYTGYVFQVAFLDKAINLGAKVAEIPIQFVDRTQGKSKINAPQYTLQTLLYMFTHSSFVKFIIVGFTGAFIDFGVSSLLKYGFGVPVGIANVISVELAIMSNYLLNNFWTFADKKVDNNPLSHLINFAKFNLVSAGNIVIQLAGIAIGSYFFGEEYWLVYKAFTLVFIVIPYSYILYNKVIWKKK